MKGKWIKYSENELKFVFDNHLLARRELTELFNKKFKRNLKVDNIKRLCARKGWSNGNTGKFVPGQSSWNVGTKGLTKRNKTTFKKGNIPHNHKPIEHEVTRKDGYVQVKIQNHKESRYNYRLKHLIIYESHHGPIPENMLVVFKDSNPLNFSIDNLELISKSENIRRNQMKYSKASKELKPVIRTLSKLKAQAYGQTN